MNKTIKAPKVHKSLGARAMHAGSIRILAILYCVGEVSYVRCAPGEQVKVGSAISKKYVEGWSEVSTLSFL